MNKNYFNFLLVGFALSLFSCKSDRIASGYDITYVTSEKEAISIPRLEPPFELVLHISEESYCTGRRYTNDELDKIQALYNLIPAIIKVDFDEKYIKWTKTWTRPEIAISSIPRSYASSEEYKELVKYCKQYGKSMWTLIYDKSATKSCDEGVHFCCNLWEDLTFSEYKDFFEYLDWFMTFNDDLTYVQASANFSKYLFYSRNLLKIEYDNILQSIKENFYPEE